MALNNGEIDCWLDCDPGHDDSLAILLASHCKKIKLIGISTVGGNQTIEKTTRNALISMNLYGLIRTKPTNLDNDLDINFDEELKYSNCLTHGGLEFPLVQGSSRPLLRPAVNCQEIHGDSGLNTHVKIELPKIPDYAINYVENLNAKSAHFTRVMYDAIRVNSKPVTVIATGPLTNIALLLINFPDISKNIEKIVMMGGAMGIGNTGPVAEFNIQVDPESAHYVFESDIPIYMVPLEVTHLALVTPQVIESIRSLSTNLSFILVELLLYFQSTYKTLFFMDYPPLHDPCAVAYIIDPTLFEHRLMRVDVEIHSHLSYGQTVCDFYNMSNKKKNVHVCMKMDVERFWNLLIEAIKSANEVSPANLNPKSLIIQDFDI
ncbi:ribonucleoside hydrolase [Brachionus plicatilis]|uniref:Ribonucleoside hydrolase n=1 Tax=Brachionus plicatilis TaxID=10195 RepID=A0A3M7PEF8_BRAPC|nr:ribonucleoside hydrolase [Brachionus plicatilis]